VCVVGCEESGGVQGESDWIRSQTSAEEHKLSHEKHFGP